MKYLLILTSIITSSVLAAENQTTLCSFGDQQRTIEVVYPQGGENICEVQYTKNNEMKTLWTARSEKEYCQSKAETFIEKQQGWGWKCESQLVPSDETEVEQEPEPVQEESDSDSNESIESAESEIE